MEITITVAICTYNRAKLLDLTLKTLACMSVPAGLDWEVLVIDNNSDDKTEAVVRTYHGRLPVRYLLERRQGLSFARNRAIDESKADYIVWTDDDVRVGSGWIAAYADAFRSWPGTGFFGGPILPWFEGNPPQWLTQGFDKVRGAYAVKDLASEPVVLKEPDDLPFGANMAFKSEALESRRFDVRLGRKGRNLIGGEESQLILELVEEGQRGRWVPDARVEHFIPQSRQTLSYLRRYYRAHGRVARLRPESDSVTHLFGRPRWAWRASLEREAVYWFSRLTGSPDRWIQRLKEAAYAQGVLLGYREAEAE